MLHFTGGINSMGTYFLVKKRSSIKNAIEICGRRDAGFLQAKPPDGPLKRCPAGKAFFFTAPGAFNIQIQKNQIKWRVFAQ
jgi:hypothetical protein